MSTVPTSHQIKGLFFHAVKAVGGVEAAGAYLQISHQRVSQLQSINCADMPTIMHIVTLEHVIGQPIITRALAESVAGPLGAADLMVEACEATEAAADLQALVRNRADHKTIRDAAVRLQREATDITAALVKPAT